MGHTNRLTIALSGLAILAGVGALGSVCVGLGVYLPGALAGFVLEGRIPEVLERRAMQRQIDQLENHVVICGYGRFGRVVVEELPRYVLPFVIGERSSVETLAQQARATA